MTVMRVVVPVAYDDVARADPLAVPKFPQRAHDCVDVGARLASLMVTMSPPV
jgi:hypothetical protein